MNLSQEPTRRLLVPLTEDEQRVKAHELAVCCEQIAANKGQAKSAAEHWKSKLKILELDLGSLADCVRTGKERRSVDVVRRQNLTHRTWEIVRCDTFETVETSPMTDAEYREATQEKLPFGGGRVETKKVPATIHEAARRELDEAIAGDSEPETTKPAKGKRVALSPKPLTATVAEHADADPDAACLNPACSSKRGQGRKGRCRPCADFLRRNGTERHVAKGATVKDSTVQASAE